MKDTVTDFSTSETHIVSSYLSAHLFTKGKKPISANDLCRSNGRGANNESQAEDSRHSTSNMALLSD